MGLLLLLLIIKATFAFSQMNSVRYYEQVIARGQNDSMFYQLPENNNYFRVNLNTSQIHDFGSYDFIIVGGGSAGCVIANRLSAHRNWRILLIEAGGLETDFSDIPAMFPYVENSDLNWGYYSVPQRGACQGMVDQRCFYPRGKALGGSSVINGIMYVRGNRADFDQWANDGNQGWSYDEVLPFFKRSERAHIHGDRGYHGESGTLHVSYATPTSALYQPFIAANQEFGRNVVDYNGRQQLGVGRIQQNLFKGRRDTAAKAFINPILHRPNLRVILNSYALKVLIDPNTKQAEGVVFVSNGTFFFARASREVIVSGGSINSPQLLMLSGIGPSDHLQQFGIETVQDLPVGRNLQDHATFYGFVFRTNFTETVQTTREYIRRYLKGTGPYTYAVSNEALGFFQLQPNNRGIPDMEFIFIAPNSSFPFEQLPFNFDRETMNEFVNNINPLTDFIVVMILLHPQSNGTVQLTSNDPLQFPAIDVNYFGHSGDMEMMYNGVQEMLKLVNSTALRRYDTRLLHYQLPACREFRYLTREFWECTISQLTTTIYHPVGTCKMGLHGSSVVNNELKVHGINKLRVADASIIPRAISGHTHAAAVMIGERISEFIRRAYHIY